MKRYTATLRVDLTAESTEARDYLLDIIADGITKKRPAVRFVDVGSAQVSKATLSRVRPKQTGAKKRKR
jgi:hypothetical protein